MECGRRQRVEPQFAPGSEQIQYRRELSQAEITGMLERIALIRYSLSQMPELWIKRYQGVFRSAVD